jgi:hypothetical protein
VIAERVRPDDEDEPGEAEFKHPVHILLSAMWGIGLLIGMVFHLIVILTPPVDVANAVGTAVSLVLTALFITATVVVARGRGPAGNKGARPRVEPSRLNFGGPNA